MSYEYNRNRKARRIANNVAAMLTIAANAVAAPGFPIAPASPAAGGLRDYPLAGGHVQYLDGSSWVASCVPWVASCSFEQGVDFDSANTSTAGMFAGIHSAQACCEVCGNLSWCAAAVWDAQYKGGSCFAKDHAALSKKVKRVGMVACTPSGTPAPPPPPRPSPCAGRSISASVPGDLLSDLQRAGLIGDPLYELNFKNATQQALWIADWEYSITFLLQRPAAGAVLVFDSIKMGARVYLGETLLGVATDQFKRYVFPLLVAAAAGDKSATTALTVRVVFDSTIDTKGRFMACSGGWDWVPYTRVDAPDGRGHVMTKGLVRSAYVAYPPPQPAPPALISALATHVFYKGDYPLEPLTDTTKADFEVQVRVFVQSHAVWAGTVEVSGSWSLSAPPSSSPHLSLPPGESNITVTLAASKHDVELWWPSGLGERPLYNVTAKLVRSDGASATAVRRVGFRVFALVTGNDTDPAWVAANEGADGSADLGMRFRVNGAALFARGGNLVPMDQLEGRNTAAAHRALVRSASEGGMNVMRVWGGACSLAAAACPCNQLLATPAPKAESLAGESPRRKALLVKALLACCPASVLARVRLSSRGDLPNDRVL